MTLAFVTLVLALAQAAPNQRQGEDAMSSAAANEPSGVELGIPDHAVFFFGKVSRGKEPQSNRRWALLDDGTVLLSKNTAKIDWSTIDMRPFDSPWEPSKFGPLPDQKRMEFLDKLADTGFFDLASVVPTPREQKVRGGGTTYVFARVGTRTKLVELRPEAKEVETIWQLWRKALGAEPNR